MHMNFIHAQASLMIIIGISFVSKRPWWMLIGILSMSKHTWWWWGFDQCTSILVDDHRDLINVSKPIFCHRDKNLVTMTIGIVAWLIFCHRDKNLVKMTKNWSRWQLELSRDQFFVIVTKIWSRWQLELSRDQFFVIVTKIWSWWQFQLSSWPIFCHRDQIFVTMTKNWSRYNSNCHRDQFFVIVTKFLSRWQKIGHATKNKKTERKALSLHLLRCQLCKGKQIHLAVSQKSYNLPVSTMHHHHIISFMIWPTAISCAPKAGSSHL